MCKVADRTQGPGVLPTQKINAEHQYLQLLIIHWRIVKTIQSGSDQNAKMKIQLPKGLRSGSGISSEYGYGSGSESRILIIKNWRKKLQLKKKFFDQKLQFIFPLASLKNVQATREAFSPQKRTSSTFFQCCGSGSASTGPTGPTCFWASRIRIRIH